MKKFYFDWHTSIDMKMVEIGNLFNYIHVTIIGLLIFKGIKDFFSKINQRNSHISQYYYISLDKNKNKNNILMTYGRKNQE